MRRLLVILLLAIPCGPLCHGCHGSKDDDIRLPRMPWRMAWANSDVTSLPPAQS